MSELHYAILVLFIVLIIIYLVIGYKRTKTVQDTSTLLKELLTLNAQYHFTQIIKQHYTFQIALSSKPKYDRYNVKNLLDENLSHNDDLIQTLKAIQNNRHLYIDYCHKVDQLQSTITQEQATALHIPYKSYQKIEQKLFTKQQLTPILDCTILCMATYTSPKGRNHYSKSAKYQTEEISKRYQLLQKQLAYQNSEEMRKKRARSQMTPKLRYSILKRDGFRCQICGRTQDDGVKLHVDHILPVSKGGETVPNNLRTLCEECNLGKSDEIE